MFNDDFYITYENIIKRQMASIENKININISDKDNQRTIADKLQDKAVIILSHIFSNGINFVIPKSNRNMADFLIKKDNDEMLLDIKTRNVNKKFSMPNITSIKRLFDLYKENNKMFAILNLDYKIKEDFIELVSIIFIPYYHIDLSCINIGNLGHGQLQIKKSFKINRNNTEKIFMNNLKNKTIQFYENLVTEINQKRIPYIKSISI